MWGSQIPSRGVQLIEARLRQAGMAIDRRTFVGSMLTGAVQAAGPANDPRSIERGVFAEVNRERESRRIPALAWSSRLAAVARRHSEEMARQQFFGHADPKRGALSERLRAAGIEPTACAENIYAQSRSTDAASAAVAGWLQSRGHRSNLLNRSYRQTAVGVAVDARGQCLITQIFLA